MKLCRKRKESTKCLEATTETLRSISASNQLQASSFSSANGRHRVFGRIGLMDGSSCVGTGAGISLADLAVIEVLAKAGAERRWLRR